MAPKFKPGKTARYSTYGVDYVVVKPKDRPAGEQPVFENSSFAVYRVP